MTTGSRKRVIQVAKRGPDLVGPKRGMTLRAVNLVPASECSACGFPMDPAGDMHWACSTDGCDEAGVPVHTGVYPIRRL